MVRFKSVKNGNCKFTGPGPTYQKTNASQSRLSEVAHAPVAWRMSEICLCDP